MIAVVTDSSCDLPAATVDDHGITVVPLTIRFGDEELVDREELPVDAFWDRLTTGDVLPTTAAPPVGRFLAAFERLAEAGADGAVVVTLSSAISGTHGSAVLAAADAPLPVRVVDSRLVSGALGLVALAGAERAAEGGTLDGVESTVRHACEGANLFAALDTLEYLRRGGRIGAAAAFFGNILDVKPLITFESGAVAAAGRVRTRSKARAAVLDHAAGLGGAARVGVVTTESSPDPAFLQAVAERVGRAVLPMRIGPVVGTHAGPGVLGVVHA
ncbi:MAG: DegV family protein [Acidimicrobiia bacterium]|nr:DegV family protein [Acidimicrobiia bacterium]